jgi:hypothetical protein
MTTKPQQNVEIVHSNQAQILPYRKEELIVDVVDNPVNPGKVSVTRNTRDDPLIRLKAGGYIDAAQYCAGRHWQQCWYDSEIGSVHAVDTTKEPVDGKGPTRPPFTDKQRKALEQLQRAAVILGFEGDRIVREILADRMSLQMVSDRHHRPKKYIGQRFREALESMAKLWSYA